MIYLIVDERDEFCKIGRSDNTNHRLLDLQVGNPLTLRIEIMLNLGNEEETKLHNKFKHLRKRGEWFYYTKEIKDLFLNYSKFKKLKKKTKKDEEFDKKIRIIRKHLLDFGIINGISNIIKSSDDPEKDLDILYRIALTKYERKLI